MREGSTKIQRIQELEALYAVILSDNSMTLEMVRALLHKAKRPADLHSKWRKSPTMTKKANGATYQEFVAQGWTDQLLRQHGYIV